jgi:hypothetical protein
MLCFRLFPNCRHDSLLADASLLSEIGGILLVFRFGSVHQKARAMSSFDVINATKVEIWSGRSEKKQEQQDMAH